MEIHLAPAEGYWLLTANSGAVVPPPPGDPAWTQMTPQELELCVTSDDQRFVLEHTASWAIAICLFRCDVSDLPIVAISPSITWRHEGYTEYVGAPAPDATVTALLVWLIEDEVWSWRLPSDAVHRNEYDTLICPKEIDPERFVDDESIWFAAYGRNPTRQSATIRFHTDFAEVGIPRPTISTADNLFNQNFRAVDGADEGDIAFERRDLPFGAWSTPVQPFAGDGNHSPALECLPSGRLRAAYIDGDGLLQERISRDDGETWEAP